MESKRWHIAPSISAIADAALSRYPRILRQLLFNRGIANEADALRYLGAAAPDITDPFLLTGMGAAVDRIAAAISAGERIAVYGDYDADGVSATALMVQTLTALDASVEPYIPNRFDEGYGLNNDALADLKQRGVSLVITVDCGIRSIDEARHAIAIGLDLVITDHHDPGPELPQAVAVINVKLPGDRYPDKNLAGVGTAYKLACALGARFPEKGFEPASLLDLVALGTVADLVPLRGENRHLVRRGLELIRENGRQGLSSLMGAAGVDPKTANAATIGFMLGPRLNAAGRLDSALAAYNLLTTQDAMRAGELAQQLDNQNRERQQITRDMQAAAETIAVPDGEIPLLLFAVAPEFNPGVVGLTASRLTEQYYRPSVVGQHGEHHTRASCRSIPEFNITAALDECAELLEHHGGHAAAAGFTVRNENLAELAKCLNAIAAERLAGHDLRPLIKADMELTLDQLTADLFNQIQLLQPTGNSNPEPVFISRELQVADCRPVGRDRSHLKLRLSAGRRSIDAIAFRQGHRQAELAGRTVETAYRFEMNEFRGSVSPQMNILDIRTA